MSTNLSWINFTNSIRYSFQVLFAASILLFGCGEEQPIIKEVNYEAIQFAPFVEPDFPFITTSLDARRLGQDFPEDNIVARGLALRLGEEAYACFDTDMLRWSVAWTGEFLPMVTLAQVSYDEFFNKNNEIPEILGHPKIATGLYPGWSGTEPSFIDPRPKSNYPDVPSWGPIPAQLGRWNGVFLVGSDLVMSYTVQNTHIYELPGSAIIEGETIFTRNIKIDDLQEALTMVAAEVQNGIRSEVEDNTLYIYHGENENQVTAIGLAGADKNVKVKVTDHRYATVQVSPGNKETKFTLGMWQGPVEKKGLFRQKLSEVTKDFPQFRKGGPAYWKETVLTQGKLAPDTATYVTDRLTLPIPNPWNRNLQVVDIDFFEDNRAAVVTFSGDVWIVDGIDQHLRKMKWRRYASGIYEPMSIAVRRDTIYVYGKEGIVRFHDLNNDGVADYYENFSNLMAQSIESREGANDMVLAPDGSFFIAKAAALDMGPKGTFERVAKGFRAGSHHSGSILKVSADGRSIEYYATGLRVPFLGIHPTTGVLSASDQQGHSVPSTPVLFINKGDYYGVPATSHLDQVPEKITAPLVWLPHNVDRSGLSQVWISSDKMGALSGELIHLSYGRPGLFKVLIDSTNNKVQGGVSFIRSDYPAPTMKAAISPRDGQLYATGFGIWGTNSDGISALVRLRYTGKESLLLKNFKIREGGILLRFDIELDEQSIGNIENFEVKRWNYLRTEEYGSGRFNLDGTAGEENLPVLSAHLSDDKHAVFLAIPDMKEVMQMQVSYKLKSVNGSAIIDTLWCTVNDVIKPDLLAAGFSHIDVERLQNDRTPVMAAAKPEAQPSIELGQQLFQRVGCIGCHTTEDNTGGMIGPPLKGLFGSEKHFKDGSTATADEEYLRESLLKPGEKIVKGYDEGMPSFLGILTDNEIESMVLYIKSL